MSQTWYELDVRCVRCKEIYHMTVGKNLIPLCPGCGKPVAKGRLEKEEDKKMFDDWDQGKQYVGLFITMVPSMLVKKEKEKDAKRAALRDVSDHVEVSFVIDMEGWDEDDLDLKDIPEEYLGTMGIVPQDLFEKEVKSCLVYNPHGYNRIDCTVCFHTGNCEAEQR